MKITQLKLIDKKNCLRKLVTLFFKNDDFVVIANGEFDQKSADLETVLVHKTISLTEFLKKLITNS
ncbi:hypothetical protein GCM10022250_44330 [Flavobacterium chungbukense]|uniref:Uncharacterized protein n=1 Tax=Flavobacterium chungbukense TaxID=877464 RepID=A0ABP7YVY1_9FLAO